MAYDHQMEQVRMDPGPVTGAGISFVGAGTDLGAYAPGLQPIEVRGIAFVMTVAATVTAPVIGLYKRPQAGVTAGAVLIKSVTAPLAAWEIGDVVYAFMDDTIANDLIIKPGEDVFCETITGPTAGSGFAVLMFQPSWDNPQSNNKMTASTT